MRALREEIYRAVRIPRTRPYLGSSPVTSARYSCALTVTYTRTDSWRRCVPTINRCMSSGEDRIKVWLIVFAKDEVLGVWDANFCENQIKVSMTQSTSVRNYWNRLSRSHRANLLSFSYSTTPLDIWLQIFSAASIK